MHHEPAHSVNDKIQSVIDEGVLVYLAPNKCISRFDEIQRVTSDQQLSFDSQGNVKLSKKQEELACDVTGELHLRQALMRRSLAFDHCGLCSYTVLEGWQNQMLQTTLTPPPPGHRQVAMQQILNADRELLSHVSQATRGILLLIRFHVHLLTHKFHFISCCYYDDIPVFELKGLGGLTTRILRRFLNVLGWQHATEGKKAAGFSPTLTALGIQFGLTSLASGSFTVENKASRLRRLLDMVGQHKDTGAKQLAAEIHRLMIFAGGFVLGYALKPASTALARWISATSPPSREAREALCDLSNCIISNLRSTQRAQL